MADWQKIKTEYITTDTSYRKLAKKYGVGASTLYARAGKEKWVEQKEQHQSDTVAKSLAADARKKVDQLTRIQNATDRLLDKIEQAITELDIQIAKRTDKTKIIEYNNVLRPDKPTKEIIKEEENLLEVKSIVDRQGLKQIASALRDIKEVQMLRTDLDRQEQEARIENLRRQAKKEDTGRDVTVVIDDGVGDYCV